MKSRISDKNGELRNRVHNLQMGDEELFALNCLVNLNVCGITWQGGDPDVLELRFRNGKIGLKARVLELVQSAGEVNE